MLKLSKESKIEDESKKLRTVELKISDDLALKMMNNGL